MPAITNTYSQTIDGQFTVGDGITVCNWTDRHAYTVVSIAKSGKRMTIRQDTATQTERLEFHQGGFAPVPVDQYQQAWTYTADPDGAELRVSLRQDGNWKVAAHGGYPDNRRVIAGRHEFYDYNF